MLGAPLLPTGAAGLAARSSPVVVDAFVLLLAAYLLGAIPFANIISVVVAGVDLRHTGSGTVSGTGLYRVAGFLPLVLGGVLDVAKGAVGPLLAGSDRPALAAAAACLAVAGHNWSIFLKGTGGRGISPALGALVVVAWPGAVLLLGAMVAGRAFRQTGLGTFVGLVVLTPALAALAGAAGASVAAAVTLPMLAKRALGNRPSRRDRPGTYLRRMIYDRPDANPHTDGVAA